MLISAICFSQNRRNSDNVRRNVKDALKANAHGIDVPHDCPQKQLDNHNGASKLWWGPGEVTGGKSLGPQCPFAQSMNVRRLFTRAPVLFHQPDNALW